MLDLAHIRALADAAHAHVCDIAEGKTKWTMRIPADENRDSDLVISNALAVMPAMADEIERLRRELDSERAELQRYRWMNHEERSVQSTPPPSGEAVRAQ